MVAFKVLLVLLSILTAIITFSSKKAFRWYEALFEGFMILFSLVDVAINIGMVSIGKFWYLIPITTMVIFMICLWWSLPKYINKIFVLLVSGLVVSAPNIIYYIFPEKICWLNVMSIISVSFILVLVILSLFLGLGMAIFYKR